MKYTKPATRNSVVLLNFLDSLPAEFEIVEPGMTQVRWPRMLTRQCLLDQAAMIGNAGFNGTASDLRELAAIAPEEKKKRKMKVLVTLDYGNYKLGPFESECEVTE